MWKDLTTQQKADVIAMAVKAGMRDINSIKSFYDDSIRSRRRFDGEGELSDTQYQAIKALEGNLFQVGGNLKGGKKRGDKVNTEQCATWSNGLLRDNGYLISGNAWRLNHVDLLFNGFDGLEKPTSYNKEAVELYNHNAAGNVFNNFDSKTLDKSKPYVVNMYYNGSPAQEEAYNNGKGVTGTHTGILTHDGKQWNVTHNIHGTIYEEPFISLQRGDNKYGVTAIYKPRKETLFNRIKGFLGFANGGPIHINPSKKGTFTAAASKHGMGVQEFASKVLANPENYSSVMRKKANFARNASKWKH